MVEGWDGDRILGEASHNGDELYIDLWYPDMPGSIKKMVIGMVDVRAADSISISYDKDRDGWIIEQGSTFEWNANDDICDPDWQEVAFVQAWGREKQGEG